MQRLLIIIIISILISCGHSDRQSAVVIHKIIHIPDTTNNWFANLFDYNNYVRKTALSKQLKLSNLEADTTGEEMRIWILGSIYNPQTVLIIKTENNHHTAVRISYYKDFKDYKGSVIDSSHKIEKKEQQLSEEAYSKLNLAGIWEQPSQSEMKNGKNYGCNDGYDLLIELNSKKLYKFSSYICPDMHVLQDTTFAIADSLQKKVSGLFKNAGNF